MDVKDLISSGPAIRVVTPGKWVSKKVGREEGSASRVEKCEEGMNSVQVKEPSWSY